MLHKLLLSVRARKGGSGTLGCALLLVTVFIVNQVSTEQTSTKTTALALDTFHPQQGIRNELDLSEQGKLVEYRTHQHIEGRNILPAQVLISMCLILSSNQRRKLDLVC